MAFQEKIVFTGNNCIHLNFSILCKIFPRFQSSNRISIDTRVCNMYFEQLLSNQLAVNQKIHQGTHNEVNTNISSSEGFGIPDIAISLTPVGLVFSWIVFFIILRKVRNILEDKLIISVKKSQQLPCKNCKFYTNNHYLKCAVNPSIVMTEEAKNCSEYTPDKKQKFLPKNIFR